MPFEVQVLDWLARFFHEQPVLSIALLALFALLILRNRRVLLLALGLTLALTPLIKDYYAIARPCAGNDSCPVTYGFPSEHAALAFVFAVASWGQTPHLLLLPVGLLIAWSRLYLGVHTFEQAAAGMALGALFVLAARAFWMYLDGRIPWLRRFAQPERPKGELSHEFETGRQVIHVLFGLFFVALGTLLDHKSMLLALAAFLSFALYTSTLKSVGLRIPVLDQYLLRFERPGAVPGRGVVMYGAGLLLLFSYAPSTTFALGIAGILALGDGLATLLGGVGWTKLPWNTKKTGRGTLAFFMGGFLASVWFLGTPGALFYSVLLALVESVEWGLDDNVLIPTAAILLNALTGV